MCVNFFTNLKERTGYLLMRHFKNIKGFFKADDNLKHFILNGIFFTLMFNCAKAFTPKFLIRIGGTDDQIFWYNSFIGLAALIATIPAIIITNGSKNKKMTMVKYLLLSRGFLLILAVIPFLSSKISTWAFLIVSSIMSIPDAIGSTAFQSFIGDTFTEEDRSSALSHKSKFSALSQVIVLILLSILLTSRNLPNETIVRIYQVLFVIGFVFGFFEIKAIYDMKELTHTSNNRVKLKDGIHSILNNKRFLIFIPCSLFFHFAFLLEGPAFSVYQISYLKINELWLSILIIITSMIAFLVYNKWNKVIKRKGNYYTLFLSSFIIALVPFVYFISKNIYTIIVANILQGIGIAGINVCILNEVLESSDHDKKIFYIGIHSILVNTMLFITPIVSNVIVETVGIYTAFIIIGCLKLIASLIFFLRFLSLKKIKIK